MTELRVVGVTLEEAVQTVACPSCRQPAGAPCRTPGKRLAPCHAPRYELAKQHRWDRQRLAAWHAAAKTT